MGNYTAQIGGVGVAVVAGSLSIDNQIGQRSTGGMAVRSAVGVRWTYGTQVAIYDDLGAVAFSGFVSKDKAAKPGGARQGTGYLEHAVSLMDNCYRADKRVVYAAYQNMTAGAIALDILGKVLAVEGVTATATSVASGATITEAIWDGKQASAALSWLAQQSGYWWTIDKNNVLWFQPYGGLAAPFVLDGTQADAMTATVEYGNDLYVNTQYAKGAYGTTPTQIETRLGDGHTTAFVMSYELAQAPTVEISLSGGAFAAATVGIGGVDSGKDWYWNAGANVVFQDTGGTKLSSADTIRVTYVGRFPVRAVAKNLALISAQKAREGASSSGIVESVYSNSKVHTLGAAFQIASSLLSHFGQDMTVLEFDTRKPGLMEGQLLTVNLPDFALASAAMLISSVKLSDQRDGFSIWYHVTAVGGPVEASQWQTYWQNLMNQQADPNDLSDTSDTSLALLTASNFNMSASFTVSGLVTIGAICGDSMMTGEWTVA